MNFQADADDHVTKADVEKARLNKEQKRTLAEDAKNEYARALVKCNEQQRNHHTKLVPDILSRYQTEFLASSEKYCSTVQSYCQVEEKFRPLMTSCLGDIQHKAKAINGKEDANLIVDEFKTGYHPPEDIQFQGKYTFTFDWTKLANFQTIWSNKGIFDYHDCNLTQ